jgi:hypothetical protein
MNSTENLKNKVDLTKKNRKFYKETRRKLHNSVVSFLIWGFILILEILLLLVLQPGFSHEVTYFDIQHKFISISRSLSWQF